MFFSDMGEFLTRARCMTTSAAWPLSVVGAEEAAVRAAEDMGGTRKGDRQVGQQVHSCSEVSHFCLVTGREVQLGMWHLTRCLETPGRCSMFPAL